MLYNKTAYHLKIDNTNIPLMLKFERNKNQTGSYCGGISSIKLVTFKKQIITEENLSICRKMLPCVYS